MQKWKDNNYVSSGRCFIRILWFLDFVYYFFLDFSSQKHSNFKDSVNEAYEKAFGKWHGMHI